MQVRKQQLELDLEQQTGSKSGKEYIKAVYCHLAYFDFYAEYIMRNARLDEAQAGVKIARSSELRHSFPPVLLDQNSWFLGFWTQIVKSAPQSQGYGFRLNYATSFPDFSSLQTADQGTSQHP